MNTTQSESSRAASGRQIEFATFYVGRILLGIDIQATDEINRQLDLTVVPHAPPVVKGVVNLRGDVVTVLDLRTILGLDPAEVTSASRNVIVRMGSEQVGLMVDRVADVASVSADDMEPPPANVNGLDGRFFKGVFKLDKELLIVLDVGAVLAAKNTEH